MEIEQADKLQEEFDRFKLDCDAIMQKKKNLIIEFTKELDYRDQTYVDSMKPVSYTHLTLPTIYSV